MILLELLVPCVMTFGFGGVFVAIVAVVINAARNGNPATQFDRLYQAGLPAQGILLGVAPRPSGLGGPIGRRFQRRAMRIDVEIPGRAPYELNTTAWVPMNCVRDVLPGATVELRVDPTNPQRIAIVGPGVGFAPPIAPAPGGASPPPPTSSGPGLGR